MGKGTESRYDPVIPFVVKSGDLFETKFSEECTDGYLHKQGPNTARRKVLKIVALCVVILLIVGLMVTLVITKLQLEECRNNRQGMFHNRPQTYVITDKTIQRASDFINYGNDPEPN